MTQTTTCRLTREGLTEYLENALSPARRQGLERHLEVCRDCQRELARLEAVIAATGSLLPERMPQAMKRRLLQELTDRDVLDAEAGGDHR